MVLAVHRALIERLEAGVDAQRLEQVDLSRVSSARESGGPDDVAAVTAVRDSVLALLKTVT